MRHLIPFAILGLVVAGPLVAMPVAASAQAATIPAQAQAPAPTLSISSEDLINLKLNGLGDEVLIALIEAHSQVFYLTPNDLITLRRRGISDRVLTVMIRSGRQPAPLSVAAAMPPVAVPVPIDPGQAFVRGAVRDALNEYAEPAEARAPTVVNVSQSVNTHVEQPRAREETVVVPVAVPVYVDRPDRPNRPGPSAPAPEYWGYGGQRRPDSWSDSKDARPSGKPEPKPGPKADAKADAKSDSKSTTTRVIKGGF
jgi:hypothetical protein